MDKVLVHIDKDEWWPVYGIRETDSRHPGNLEMGEADYKRVMKIQKQFKELQKELENLWQESI